MNANDRTECREYQEQIVLFLYDELTEGEQTHLETHLQQCSSCNQSFENEKGFHAALDAAQNEENGPWNVPSDLLVESRRELANELDRIERRRSWWSLPTFSVVFSPMRLLEWTTLIAVGMAAGVYVNTSLINRPVSSVSSQPGPIVSSEPESISNLRIVSSDSMGNVEIVGNLVRPMRFQGNLRDDMAQQLLVGTLRNGQTPSARLGAVEVLAREPETRSIQQALLHALIEDDNRGVRLKALQSLKPYANDRNVQAAFINVLEKDEDAGIRRQAIDALKGFAKDDTVAKSVQEVTKNEDNPLIRLEAIQFVGTRP